MQAAKKVGGWQGFRRKATIVVCLLSLGTFRGDSLPAGRLPMNEFPTVRPEQRVNHPVFGDDPFLTFVSQNEGDVTGLLRDEVFSRIKGAERTRNVLAFKHNEWMGSVNNVLIKQSCKHTERSVSKRRSRLRSMNLVP